MALVTPLLIILMFGSFELGNYFLSEHVVVKAVRDGARYASRLNLSNFDCSSASSDNTLADAAIEENIQNLVRTGLIDIDEDEEARLRGWSDGSDIHVEYDCVAVDEADPPYSGIYAGLDFVPVVHVEVRGLDYTSLFNDLGFTSSTITLNAEAQSAVMGI
ncbi:TadE family protein [Sphingobium herbicidovorans NBRC 16415]|uniref:TadE family protein n=2 Tax=Sphingobium herbicidovorans TaxID=76947 RepID=A0A086P8C3_SPHHM|nr:TadE/TadG family type IV pilus assembly protein [Sphingobium herbicidovorans]KFG89641.1 TadE family protein [Sphingobium herbicidovorans NBRC 16415]